MTAVGNLTDFRALEPFFRIITEGVAGLVDGEHFFDLLAEDVVFEYIITVPDYPRRVEGRLAVAELYRPYGATFFLDRCYGLAVHHDQATGVVVLEYASQGRAIPTGNAYGNHYVSVLSIVDRKIVHWRDYLDPLAVFDAIGWPAAATRRAARRTGLRCQYAARDLYRRARGVP
jgi:ketosteroid isomerase-like protein